MPKLQSSFKWFGSQYGNMEFLTPFMSVPHEVFIDCFCGSGILTINHPLRPPNMIMVDLDDRVTKTFHVIREQTERLAEVLWLTPWSQAEYLKAIGPIDGTEDELEIARRFLFACTASIRGGSEFGQRDFRIRKTGTSSIGSEMDNLIRKIYGIANRLRDVQIVNNNAIDFLIKGSKRVIDNPNSLIVADPPWMEVSTTGYKLGSHETLHDKLFEVLDAAAGYVLILGIQNNAYNQTYESAGWQRFDHTYRMNSAAVGSMAVWANPKLAAAPLNITIPILFEEYNSPLAAVGKITGTGIVENGAMKR